VSQVDAGSAAPPITRRSERFVDSVTLIIGAPFRRSCRRTFSAEDATFRLMPDGWGNR
jgi:hypothetical protein